MKKLLVVVDMQNDFVTGVLGTKEAQAVTPKIKDFVKKFKGDVVFTQDTHTSKYMKTQEGKNLPVPHCIKYTEGWKIVPELAPLAEGRRKFFKPTFGSLELGKMIRNGKYDEVYFCGVCTGICVINNAMLAKANAPETKVIVKKDLCACVTPKSHETALEAMQTCQITVE